MHRANIIAIDGPAASGKSTLGKKLAERLGYLYLDTGVMYRAITWMALKKGIPLDDEGAVTHLAQTTHIDIQPASIADGRDATILADGEDVTWEIRKPEVDANVSLVSSYAGVRKALSEQQRRLGTKGRIVMVGRDIGTVVLPNADLKIFLDASVEERARRRYLEKVRRGENATYTSVLEAMITRDEIDSSRALAPLKPAEDAHILNTDGMEADEVFEHVIRWLGVDAEAANQWEEAKQNSLKTSPKKHLYRVSLFHRVMRFILRPIFRGLFHILGRVRIIGKENIPKQGAYLTAINHISIYEPPFVMAFWPKPLEAAGAKEVWERQGQDILVRLYGAIPVHRGQYDRKLLDTMIAVLQSGLPLLIAPEGGRSHRPGLRRAYPGAAYIVEKTNVPIVPVGIVGSTEDFFSRAIRGEKPLIEMRIGKPFYLPPITAHGQERRLARQKNADLIMAHIAQLLPEEYRGVYAEAVAEKESSIHQGQEASPEVL